MYRILVESACIMYSKMNVIGSRWVSNDVERYI